MFLQRVASILVFLAGMALLRVSVLQESWSLLVAGLGVAAGGLTWLVLAGASTQPPQANALSIQRHT